MRIYPTQRTEMYYQLKFFKYNINVLSYSLTFKAILFQDEL